MPVVGVSSAGQRFGSAVSIIERLLCADHAGIGVGLVATLACDFQPFVARGLASLDDEWLTISPESLPYARTIAAHL
jgi:oxygen-independent coproporphyrinogen-3 oxidase